MSWENTDKFWDAFEQLSIEQQRDYLLESFTEQITDIVRQWDDNLLKEEIEYMKQR